MFKVGHIFAVEVRLRPNEYKCEMANYQENKIFVFSLMA